MCGPCGGGEVGRCGGVEGDDEGEVGGQVEEGVKHDGWDALGWRRRLVSAAISISAPEVFSQMPTNIS